MPGQTTKTAQPHDFLEMSNGQFEDLVRQLAGTSGVDWTRAPEPVGRLGSDRGRDIRGTERVPGRRSRGRGEREWRYQAKRWKEIGPKTLRTVVGQAVPDPSELPHALVVAVACRVSDKGFEAFHDECEKLAIAHHELWTKDSLNDKLVLNENARIAAFYFGDGPAIEGTVPIPLALDRSPGRDLTLLGRADDVERLRTAPGDVVIVGRPGTGKSRLAMELDGVRFLTLRADADTVAESLRRYEPAHLVIDDAGLAIDRLEMLLELRREGHRFAIVATTWTENLGEVKRWSPDATLVELQLLERKTIDELLRALGVTNYYLRSEILEQAQGRAGWAVALADLAKRGRGRELISGRGLINQVEPFLTRLGASSAKALGLLSVIGALGEVGLAKELPDLEAYLSLGRLDGQQLLQDAAAAGVLELQNDALRVAPNALRFALVGYWFFEQLPAPWSIDDILAQWPAHRSAILLAVLEAAWDGSAKARSHLELLLPSVADVPQGMLDRYVALDEHAAVRAVSEIEHLPADSRFRREILVTAAKRFALPSAIRGLLDSAVGDLRPGHSNPDHPVRVLGEIGSRISPHGETSFGARASVLATANAWLDPDPSPPRQLVWAGVVAHLLDPKVEGTYPDPGSPMTINLRGGFETTEHLESIVRELWPQVAIRLHGLESEALVALVAVVDDWIRLERQLEGPLGATPTDAQVLIAGKFVPGLLAAFTAAFDGHPAAQMTFRETTRIFHVSIHQKIDPEFRLLSWMPWRLPGHGQSGLITRTVGRLADCWVTEDPAVLMNRLADWSVQAAYRKRDLQPMIHLAFEALAQRSHDVDGLIAAGFAAGLSWHLRSLFKASIDRINGAPAWLPEALAGPARSTAIAIALASGPNRAAAEAALAALGKQDLFLIEPAIWSYGQLGHDWASLALLRHPSHEIRGNAALWFGLDGSDYLPVLPDDWYFDWSEAFMVAPITSTRGDGYRLGEQLGRLVSRDPDLVERWLMGQLAMDPPVALWRLPDEAQSSLLQLPRPNRDRLIRTASRQPRQADLLGYLLGDDIEWLEELLDDGIVETGSVLATLNLAEREIPDRVRRILLLAPVLVPRGVEPQHLARTAELGGWRGERSALYESIRVAFAAAPIGSDSNADVVRLAGIEMFEQARDEALHDERLRRVSGDL